MAFDLISKVINSYLNYYLYFVQVGGLQLELVQGCWEIIRCQSTKQIIKKRRKKTTVKGLVVEEC